MTTTNILLCFAICLYFHRCCIKIFLKFLTIYIENDPEIKALIINFIKLFIKSNDTDRFILVKLNDMVKKGKFDDIIHNSIKSLVVSEINSIMKHIPIVSRFYNQVEPEETL